MDSGIAICAVGHARGERSGIDSMPIGYIMIAGGGEGVIRRFPAQSIQNRLGTFSVSIARHSMFVAGLLVAVVVGCGPRVDRYPVEGVITLDGKPVKGASVTFVPQASGHPGVAITGDDGAFRLQELRGHDGVVPGKYRVAVFLAEWSKVKTVAVPFGPESGGATPGTIEMIEGKPMLLKHIVPERYGTADTSGLNAEITGPTKGLTFALRKKM